MMANRNCGQEFVEVTWQASRGAQNYTVTAVDENGNRLTCASSETSCRLDGVMCSHVYNVSVAAMEDSCTSLSSPPVTLHIEPCPPSELTALLNCPDNSANLTWGSSLNAVSYTGKAMSSDGHTVTCEAGLTLGCQLKGLHCGKKYTFTVSASDGDCRTIDSEPVSHTTAPCAVQDVLTEINCSTNALSISWTPQSIPVNYSTTAVGANGTMLSCLSEDNKCTLVGLQCGDQYTVSVKPISSTCEGQSSVPESVNSAPCVPLNVQGNVECSTNTLQASWDAAAGATSYISLLKGAGGAPASCQTPNQSCSFPNLQCAQIYSFSVVAINDRCNSTESSIVTTKTAPCDPANVAASLNCLSDVVTVTWSASAGADQYTVLAEASGHVDSCNSTGTSCELTELQCGENYTVTVLAGDTMCNSSILAKTNVLTAPCTPVITDYSHHCITNNTLVTWDEDEDAVSVTVNANSDRGHSLSCSSSSNNSCVLDNLLCGHTYTVQAVANGVQCSSKPSPTFQIITAPCTPRNVEYQYYCGSGIALVSWDEALGRDSFHVRAHSGTHAVFCTTFQDTDCSLPPLLCSRTYDVEVIAVADGCNSTMPGVTQIQTAPCAPTNLSASLLCENNTAEVSWEHTPGAVMYSVTATGRNGDRKQCTTNTSSCQLPNMHCAQTYLIVVSPSSNVCKGQDSLTYTYYAGPCPPTNIRASLQCAGNIGHVSWDAALRAEMYEVMTLPSVMDERVHNCSTDGTNCSLTELHCGETVAITVVTIERGCRSQPSEPLMFKTVICPPTDLSTVTTCSNNDITVSWNLSPETGAQYFIHSQKDEGAATNFTSLQPFYLVSGLHCSELYTFQVAALNSQCSSVFSEQIQAETAPCPPSNLTVKTECGTNMAILGWDVSRYAISYTATFTGTHGHVVSCSTNTTSCSVKVDCGRQYSADVVASTETCNSSNSAVLTFDSGTSKPAGIRVVLSCSPQVHNLKY
uniref:Fibronectin type-III domain-containing protein n=1 Tax=Cyprinodon variegatus TaxID=28743 RepID=A0A3Q2E2M1_CYPVA